MTPPLRNGLSARKLKASKHVDVALPLVEEFQHQGRCRSDHSSTATNLPKVRVSQIPMSSARPASALETVSDDGLMRLYARGDRRAAAELTARLGPRLLAFATRMLAGDRAEAEDVTQETMLRLWRAAGEWETDGAAKPSTWAFRVASNLCIDRQRKSRKVSPGLDHLPEQEDTSPNAEAQLGAAERLAALDRGLAELPDRQRLAVVLRHIEGWPNPDIAAHMDISVDAVESLTARGKRALAKVMAAQKEALGYE